MTQKAVLKELESRLKRDLTFKSGRIIGSMFTLPHPFARKIYARYLEKNLGNSGLCPEDILALWLPRNFLKRSMVRLLYPSLLIVPFDKAAEMLGLKIVKVGLNSRFQVDVNAVEQAVNKNTIAIIGIAGTTGLGVVDPSRALSKIALENEVYLHMDAAFGGFVLPFLKELSYNLPDFDFALDGVCSMTVDPHKMGLAPIPAGGILFRNDEIRRAVTWKISYLAGGETEQATIVGTRSGTSVIAVWALLKHLGVEGYKRIVKHCMHLKWKLVEEIRRIDGLNIVVEPIMNIVGLKSNVFNVRTIAQKLRLKGLVVSLFPSHIRVVIMPHIHAKHIKSFVEDLKEITAQLRECKEKEALAVSPI
ncbi:MAG: tyrosine decarboxylase MfnA [Candidatus Bathycorpusculaceae bacterium]